MHLRNYDGTPVPEPSRCGIVSQASFMHDRRLWYSALWWLVLACMFGLGLLNGGSVRVSERVHPGPRVKSAKAEKIR